MTALVSILVVPVLQQVSSCDLYALSAGQCIDLNVVVAPKGSDAICLKQFRLHVHKALV